MSTVARGFGFLPQTNDANTLPFQQVAPDDRLSIKQVLGHPWLAEERAQDPSPVDTQVERCICRTWLDLVKRRDPGATHARLSSILTTKSNHRRPPFSSPSPAPPGVTAASSALSKSMCASWSSRTCATRSAPSWPPPTAPARRTCASGAWVPRVVHWSIFPGMLSLTTFANTTHTPEM